MLRSSLSAGANIVNLVQGQGNIRKFQVEWPPTVSCGILCSCQRSRAAPAAIAYAHPPMATSVFHVSQQSDGRRAFTVSGPQRWNQLTAATRATCTNTRTPDCFRKSNHPMGPVGRVPPKIWEPWDQYHLVPSNFHEWMKLFFDISGK